MDIVYTLRNCNICEELVYSLRSLRNLPHDKIFFAGGFPNNIRREDIVHISTTQTGTKWQNSLNNIKFACLDNRLSDDFILMNDDFFILKPITVQQLNLNLGTVADVYSKYLNRNSSSLYAQGMKRTAEYLFRLGITIPLSFELHIPMVLNKKKVLQIFEMPGINDIPALHLRTIYGNLFIKDSIYHKDVKVLNSDIFCGTDDTFLSCGDFTWKQVKPFLEKALPEKSRYEF